MQTNVRNGESSENDIVQFDKVKKTLVVLAVNDGDSVLGFYIHKKSELKLTR